jgi:hypothetical protein
MERGESVKILRDDRDEGGGHRVTTANMTYCATELIIYSNRHHATH